MAHDQGPAPVPMFFVRRVCTAARRFTLGAALLCLAVPLFAQQNDPAVAAQAILAKCEKIFLTCATACVADTCGLCEEERKLCKANVNSLPSIPTPRLPAGSVLPGGWVFPDLPSSAGGYTTTPFPWPQPGPTPQPQTPAVIIAAPPEQPASHCDPRSIDQILQRYRDQLGVPSVDRLRDDIKNDIEKMKTRITAQKKIISDLPPIAIGTAPDPRLLKAIESIKQAELTIDFLNGAGKLLDEMGRTGKGGETTLIALQVMIDRARDEKRGLTDRGTVANLSVWLFGSDAAVIRDGAPSYHDKQNALAHILARYAKDKTLWGIDDDNAFEEILTLADTTARESVIASCRAEKMGGGSSLAACEGVELQPAACCTAKGIGTRVPMTWFKIAKCKNRTPKTMNADGTPYMVERNGCGPAVLSFIPDLPDNPNWRILKKNKIGPIQFRTPDLSYFGPSFFPACDFHDDCWGTCHTNESGLSQDACDGEFGRRMTQICDSARMDTADLMECRRAAWRYERYVSWGGRLGLYRASQAGACDCCEGAKV